MPHPGSTQQIADTITHLAEQIARSSPEAAALAMQIVELARDVTGAPDQGTIKDVLDTEMLDNTLSDMEAQTTASVVAKALKS